MSSQQYWINNHNVNNSNNTNIDINSIRYKLFFLKIQGMGKLGEVTQGLLSNTCGAIECNNFTENYSGQSMYPQPMDIEL